MLISLFDNGLIQGLFYSGAAVGLTVSFRVLRYPDLTADGSFLLGASVLATGVHAGLPWSISVVLALIVGAMCGILTGLLHFVAGVSKLLSGILTSMICYSISFRFLGSRPTVGLTNPSALFDWARNFDSRIMPEQHAHPSMLAISFLSAGFVVVLSAALLRSEWGLMLHAVGSNPRLVEGLGRRSTVYVVSGLAWANLLVAFSGALIATYQQFVDVNMALGIVVIAAAGLVFGEQIVHAAGFNPARQVRIRAASGVIGMVAYYLLYLFVLRASIAGWIPLPIQPSDIKLIAAVILAVCSYLAYRHIGQEEEFAI